MTAFTPISHQIWDMKYRFKSEDGSPIDQTISDTFRRVANSLASVEKKSEYWEEIFYKTMVNFNFIPAGRIISGAGTKRNVTLFNCFVGGEIPDDMSGIFTALKEAALTMQQGGGIGYNFSSLRPKDSVVNGVGSNASGPLAFMDVWDSMCQTIMSAGSRRGAMMAVMRCDHPDIERFIEAKKEPKRFRMFNLSVLVTNKFMNAVKEDKAWHLWFEQKIYKSMPARKLWDKIMRANYEFAEPGVIFVDSINNLNPLNYCETIETTNPCGEQPLPPNGACLLGSINLARLVINPFSQEAKIDEKELIKLVAIGVRMLDNAIGISSFPLDIQEKEANSKRRLGLGVTGLADALIMVGVRYGSPNAVTLAENWMSAIRRASYLASIQLAKEKGSFPLFDKDAYLSSGYIPYLDEDIKNSILKYGIRNSHLTSIAPTGTISLLADNVSSGLEPVFSFAYTRHFTQPDGTRQKKEVYDYAYLKYRKLKGKNAPLTPAFVDSQLLTPDDHLVMQAVVQKHIDSSISKTINCPQDMTYRDFKDIYLKAFELGCKGCTTYRPNKITGAVLEKNQSSLTENHSVHAKSTRDLPSRQDIKRANIGRSNLEYITKPSNQTSTLEGQTYKIECPIC